MQKLEVKRYMSNRKFGLGVQNEAGKDLQSIAKRMH